MTNGKILRGTSFNCLVRFKKRFLLTKRVVFFVGLLETYKAYIRYGWKVAWIPFVCTFFSLFFIFPIVPRNIVVFFRDIPNNEKKLKKSCTKFFLIVSALIFLQKLFFLKNLCSYFVLLLPLCYFILFLSLSTVLLTGFFSLIAASIFKVFFKYLNFIQRNKFMHFILFFLWIFALFVITKYADIPNLSFQNINAFFNS